MRFQKTTEYAIRVMVYLANHRDVRYSTNHLHRELNIPYKYLGRLMKKLSDGGLIDVMQGKYGGYSISKNLTAIFLFHIIEIVEGLDNYNRCILGFPECSADYPCSLHKRWLPHQEAIKEMLYNTSLEDLKKEGNIKV
jgi:Rrf2 family protein